MHKSKEMGLSDLDKKLLAMDPEVCWLYPAICLIWIFIDMLEENNLYCRSKGCIYAVCIA